MASAMGLRTDGKVKSNDVMICSNPVNPKKTQTTAKNTWNTQEIDKTFHLLVK